MAEHTIDASFTIQGRFSGNHCFPSLNDYLGEIGRNPRAGGRYKKQYVFIAQNALRRDLRHYKAHRPIFVHFTFCEPRKGHKRDRDNIAGLATKFIFDAMRDAKVIQDDRPEYVVNFDYKFIYSDGLPFIRVDIEEVETPAQDARKKL